MDDEIQVGTAVQLKSGTGPIMTVLGPDEPPVEVPGMLEWEARQWKPGGWRVAWHVQGALRTAVLPTAALRIVDPVKTPRRSVTA
jgi:hypothetical protein